MQAHYLWLHNDFYVFIQKRGGSYFYIRGSGGIAFAPGSYVNASMAGRELSRLRSIGYQERLVDLDAQDC